MKDISEKEISIKSDIKHYERRLVNKILHLLSCVPNQNSPLLMRQTEA